MEIADSQKPYLLTTEKHNEIYLDIKEQLFSGLGRPTPGENKYAMYLGAQPGSGKTALRNYLLDNMDIGKKTIVLNADELRDFHPNYHTLQADSVLYVKAPYLVNPDTNGWYNKLQKEASDKGYHIMYDSTLGGNVQDYAASMKARITDGYTPSLHVLAIHRDLSKLGIYLRYETQVHARGTGRFVSMATHDVNYKNLLPNIGSLLDQIPWHKVEVFTRHIDVKNGEIINNAVKPVYSSGKEIDKEAVLKIIQVERSRHWTNIEREYLQFRINQVEKLIKGRNGDLGQFYNDIGSLIASLDNRENKGMST